MSLTPGHASGRTQSNLLRVRGGASMPRWSADGRELIYRTADSHIVSAAVRTGESPTIELGSRFHGSPSKENGGGESSTCLPTEVSCDRPSDHGERAVAHHGAELDRGVSMSAHALGWPAVSVAIFMVGRRCLSGHTPRRPDAVLIGVSVGRFRSPRD
jgi:hypothetical protein